MVPLSHLLQVRMSPSQSRVTCHLLIVAVPYYACIPKHLLFVLFFSVALNIICPHCIFCLYIFRLPFLNINFTRSGVFVCLFTAIFLAPRTCQAHSRHSRKIYIECKNECEVYEKNKYIHIYCFCNETRLTRD